ncbi:MAG: beta-ketoacyl synthase N-terminal-like domain-containing protein, partial [Planctomycetota bacterium]|nr:beta-ketoacyl synthase N-terminal-like domain-containing protein [Planctomycetota bacterium]
TPLPISGIGLVTPLGLGAWPTVAALLAGRTTADRLASLPEEAIDPTWIARATAGCAVAPVAAEDPAVEIGERAAREALDDAGLGAGEEIDLVLAASKGAIAALCDPKSAPALRERAAAIGPHGALIDGLRRRLAGRTLVRDAAAPVAACATSIAALREARRRIEMGWSRRVVIVAVEAALLPQFVWSYKRLGVLAGLDPATAHVARPLDAGRDGFTLCECAAAVVIESEKSLRERGGKSARARLLGTALATQPDDMVRAAARFDSLERLTRAVAGEREIALLHPHATGTKDNDERELAALAAALGDERAARTPVYASKGAIGHPLGAAGLVNVVMGCVFARAKKRPPMKWIERAVESAFPIERDAVGSGGGAQVVVAAGFGGHVGAALFEAE